MRQKLVVSILCVMSMFLYPGKIFAYPLDVHERITIKLINQNEQVLNNHLKNIGLSKGVDENINKMTVRKWIEYGSWKEDFNWDLTNNPLYSHFYNPLTNTSGVGDTWPSAYDWAEMPNNEWAWKKAREYYYLGLTANGNPYGQNSRELFLSFAFRALGHSMHLVQDMAVPAHTRGDLHADIIISSIVGKDYYEAYTKKAIDYLNYKEVPFPYWNVSISPGAPRQFWDLDSYKGTVPYYTGYIGLAEYTNANFFSRDTIFKDFPHPAKENTTAALYEQTAKDGKLDSVWYIQGYTSERLAAYSYFWKNGIPPTAGWLYNLDDYVHEDYARQLIPRAVGYSAGLLNYFFRGNMDMKPDDATGSGYVILNNSDEDMNGTFELFYDKTSDERVKITVPILRSPLTISKKSSGNNKSPIITFSAPTDAKEPGKYMLVFRGKLGAEGDAVVAKRVKALAPRAGIITSLGSKGVSLFILGNNYYRTYQIELPDNRERVVKAAFDEGSVETLRILTTVTIDNTITLKFYTFTYTAVSDKYETRNVEVISRYSYPVSTKTSVSYTVNIPVPYCIAGEDVRNYGNIVFEDTYDVTAFPDFFVPLGKRPQFIQLNNKETILSRAKIKEHRKFSCEYWSRVMERYCTTTGESVTEYIGGDLRYSPFCRVSDNYNSTCGENSVTDKSDYCSEIDETFGYTDWRDCNRTGYLYGSDGLLSLQVSNLLKYEGISKESVNPNFYGGNQLWRMDADGPCTLFSPAALRTYPDNLAGRIVSSDALIIHNLKTSEITLEPQGIPFEKAPSLILRQTEGYSMLTYEGNGIFRSHSNLYNIPNDHPVLVNKERNGINVKYLSVYAGQPYATFQIYYNYKEDIQDFSTKGKAVDLGTNSVMDIMIEYQSDL